MTEYIELCTKGDLFAHGLPSSLPNPARRIVADADADTISLDAHGFVDGLVVQFRAEAGGTLPPPLVKGSSYYVRDAGDNSFRVSATLGGSAIDLTSAGAQAMVIAPIQYEAAIRWASAIVLELLPGSAQPLAAPYPAVVVISAAELAVWKLYKSQGADSKSLTDLYDSTQKRLDRWAKGAPILNGGTEPPKPAQLAVLSGAGDRRGWRRYGGL